MSGLLLLPPIPTQAPLQDSAGNLTPAWVAWFLSVATLLQAPVNGGSLTNVPIGSLTAGNLLAGAVIAPGGSLREGQTAYDTGVPGFWLGDVAGIAKFSLGDPSGAALLWDGTTLVLRSGDITLAAAAAPFPSETYKFAPNPGSGGGAPGVDMFGLNGYGSTDNRNLALWCVPYPSDGNPQVGTILLDAKAYNGAGVAGRESSIALISDRLSEQGSIELATTDNVFLVVNSHQTQWKSDGSVVFPGTIAERLRTVPLGEWQAYTPAWSSDSNPQPAIGNGSITGRYMLVGKTCRFWIQVSMGTTTTFGTGLWAFTLPLAIAASGLLEGPALMSAGGSVFTVGVVQERATGGSTCGVIPQGGGNFIQSTTPFMWGSGQGLRLNGSYEIA